MQKIASFIVKKRNFILAIMLILTALCGFFIPRVSINTDMTKYLPNDSSMKKGMDIMESEFPDTESTYTIRVMFENLTDEEKSEIQASLSAIANVESVAYDRDSADYNSGAYTLYVLSTKYGYDTAEETEIERSILSDYSDYQVTVKNDDTSNPSIPPFVIVLAFVILMVVLFLSCGSYFEPFLFLATIGIAIVINLGTNIFWGEVSDITSGIAAILQLVLSMDYSIILMNRFRQELETQEDRQAAMTAALTGAFSSITSSAFTTVVGLLMLVFMSFQIGADLGIVLAKGVVCSLLCVLLVLPSLILLFTGLIQKTAKKETKESCTVKVDTSKSESYNEKKRCFK